MNKYIALIAAILLIGCDRPRTGEHSELATDPGLYKDRETGCEYLARGNQYGGLTPRMDSEGKHICRK